MKANPLEFPVSGSRIICKSSKITMKIEENSIEFKVLSDIKG